MPFGYNCEYETFDACIADQKRKGKSDEAARRICGAIKRETEDKCKRRHETPKK